MGGRLASRRRSPVKYHYFHSFFTYLVRRRASAVGPTGPGATVFSRQAPRVVGRAAPRSGPGGEASGGRVRVRETGQRAAVAAPAAPGPPSGGGPRPADAPQRDPIRGHCQAGSLTGAVHLSKDNAGVLRPAQRGQKPRVEQKGKCWLDPGAQCAQGPRKRGLSILLA